jgi:hypothetical protein
LKLFFIGSIKEEFIFTNFFKVLGREANVAKVGIKIKKEKKNT